MTSTRLRPCLALLMATLAVSAVVEAQTGPCPPPDPAAVMPVPLGPSGTIFNSRPTFSWNAVPGYDYYVLKLLHAPQEEQYVNPPGGLLYIFGTSWTPPFDLPTGDPGMRWAVKVACTSNGGGLSYGFYSPDSFFTIGDNPPPPGACGQCFGGLNSCRAECPGTCERRVNCGTSGYKCFC